MRLAFVVQRYGASIAGGSEAHCRELAQRLAPAHDVTVLTTCATDYVTWANALPAGPSTDGPVRVIRFPVRRQRRMKRFADISDEVFDGGAPRELQEEWFRENGPDAPGLLEYLAAHRATFDLVMFWTFRYAPSYFGVPIVQDRAVLVPTAEEDAAISLDVLEDYFRKPRGYLFLTPEEETLVSARAGRRLEPAATIGIGLERAMPGDRTLLARYDIPAEYVLYLGRVDRNKGCQTLFEYFEDYAVSPAATTLVLAGPLTLRVPRHPRITALGYVPDDARRALLTHARLLLVPSRYESLSIALLEAWNHAVPALVNRDCRVLRGQVERANGGLSYGSSSEFREGLEYLLCRPDTRDAFGRQGLAYVDREYRWPTVLGRVEALLSRVHEGGR